MKLLQGKYGDHFDWVSSEDGSVKSDDSGESALDGFGIDADEMAELLGALLELRSGLRKLQWYGGEIEFASNRTPKGRRNEGISNRY